MATTDTTVSNLIINKLSKAEYDNIQSLSDTELYLVPEEVDSVPTNNSDNLVASGGVYTALANKIDKSSTAGLVKNDGTIDTSTYLTSFTEVDPVYSASAAAGIASADITSWNGKAEKVVVVNASTLPASLDPNKVYQFGTLTGTVTIPAFASVASGDTEAKVWCFTFNTSSTAPTITWPAAITGWSGGSAPTINASKSYEVSVMDGIGVIIEA